MTVPARRRDSVRPVLALLMVAALPIASDAQPPDILQIYREPLKPGVEADYARIEADTARKCAELHCPNAYLGLESLTGPKEVWWFNGYESDAHKARVMEAWAKNKALVEVLTRNSTVKQPLTGTPTEAFAKHRPDLGGGPPWRIGRGRFLVITTTTGAPPPRGTVFETADGTRFAIVPARTREEADAAAVTAARAAGGETRVFAVRPSWSHPAPDWVASDPEFWQEAPRRDP